MAHRYVMNSLCTRHGVLASVLILSPAARQLAPNPYYGGGPTELIIAPGKQMRPCCSFYHSAKISVPRGGVVLFMRQDVEAVSSGKGHGRLLLKLIQLRIANLSETVLS